MKKFLLVLIVMLPFLSVQAQKTTFTTATDFNDFLINEQLRVQAALNNLNATLEAGTDEAVWDAYEDLIAVTESSIEDVQNLVPYEGGNNLHISFNALLKFYLVTFKTDYNQILTLLLKEEVTEEDNAKVASILEKIASGEASYDANFAAAQESFASLHGFTLTTE